MKLADLRKLAIRQQVRIRFSLSNGMECVVGADGVARVPALRRAPDFNLEQELASAAKFLLEPAAADPKNPTPPRSMGREELAALSNSAGVPSGPAAAHEEE